MSIDRFLAISRPSKPHFFDRLFNQSSRWLPRTSTSIFTQLLSSDPDGEVGSVTKRCLLIHSACRWQLLYSTIKYNAIHFSTIQLNTIQLYCQAAMPHYCTRTVLRCQVHSLTYSHQSQNCKIYFTATVAKNWCKTSMRNKCTKDRTDLRAAPITSKWPICWAYPLKVTMFSH